MIPIVSKAFPSSGRDDSYLPGWDDKLPIIGRMGPSDANGRSTHERTYAAPSEGGEPTRLLPPWLQPAETNRDWQHGIGRMFAFRDNPINVGGPAFQISAQKQFQNAQHQSSKQGKLNRPVPSDPKP